MFKKFKIIRQIKKLRNTPVNEEFLRILRVRLGVRVASDIVRKQDEERLLLRERSGFIILVNKLKTMPIPLIIALIAVLGGGGVTFAAQDDLPGDALYPVKILSEDAATFFAFGHQAKINRHINLTEKRLKEARLLAEAGDENVEEAVENYEEELDEVVERMEKMKNADAMSKVAEATAKHLSMLDKVMERVPVHVKDKIRQAKEKSMHHQFSALKRLGQMDPERMAAIFTNLAEERLEAAEQNTEEGDDETAEENISDYEKYAEFGQEISSLARGIRTGTTTVEELVKKATSHHIEILEQMRQKLPDQAHKGLEQALESAKKMRMRMEIHKEMIEEDGETEDLEEFENESEEETEETEETEEEISTQGASHMPNGR